MSCSGTSSPDKKKRPNLNGRIFQFKVASRAAVYIVWFSELASQGRERWSPLYRNLIPHVQYFILWFLTRKKCTLIHPWWTLKRLFQPCPCQWRVFRSMTKKVGPESGELYPPHSPIVLLRLKSNRVCPSSSSRTAQKVPGQVLLMFAKRNLLYFYVMC